MVTVSSIVWTLKLAPRCWNEGKTCVHQNSCLTAMHVTYRDLSVVRVCPHKTQLKLIIHARPGTHLIALRYVVEDRHVLSRSYVQWGVGRACMLSHSHLTLREGVEYVACTRTDTGRAYICTLSRSRTYSTHIIFSTCNYWATHTVELHVNVFESWLVCNRQLTQLLWSRVYIV